jgi:hypothetical protein
MALLLSPRSFERTCPGDLWILSLISKLSCRLADLAAVDNPLDVDTESITGNLATLRNQLQEFIPRVVIEVACACAPGLVLMVHVYAKTRRRRPEQLAEQCTAIVCFVHDTGKFATHCDERARDMKRVYVYVSGIYGCNFHPGSTCTVCKASPIVG